MSFDSQAIESNSLPQRVGAIAERFVADLQQAETQTGGWSNERLSDLLVDAALSRCLRGLAATGCVGEANRIPSGELWRIAGSFLEFGSLHTHARFKPHGYAGDHIMLTRIWEHSCSDHPLGRAFDRFFLSQAAPSAVRSRMELAAAALAEHCLQSDATPYHVVSVGAGPAIDVALALDQLPSERRAQLHVTLLDLDPAALAMARDRVEPLLPEGALACIRENLFRLPKKADAGAMPPQIDFLICSGLFDYLHDDAAVAMLDLFYHRLSPSGKMLIGNFAPHNPTRPYMEWVGNWYLLHRTAEDLRRLAAQGGIPSEHFHIGAERLGIDLFLQAGR